MEGGNLLMIRTLASMLALMVILLFPGLPIINSIVADTLASPSVSGTLLEIPVRLFQGVYVVGSIIGMPILIIRYVIGNHR